MCTLHTHSEQIAQSNRCARQRGLDEVNDASPLADEDKKELIAGRILDRMPLGCLISDRSFRFLDWNPEAERIFGFTRREALGRHYFELIVPARQQGAVNALFERFVHGEMDVKLVGFNCTKSGETISCEWHNTPLFDEQGNFEGLVALVRDVSEQRRGEEALRDSEAFLEHAQEVAKVGSWVSSLEVSGRLRWSKQVFRIFNVREEDFDGRVQTFFDYVHPDDRTAVLQASKAAVEHGAPYDIDHRIIRPDGVTRWVRERAIVYRGQDGEPERMIGIVQDITEQRASEERLRESMKLEAIGRLAGGIAHDFNNLLTVVIGHGELLRDALELGDSRRDDVEELLSAAGQAAALGRQLLALGRGQVLQLSVVDLNAVLRETEPMLRRLLGKDIRMEIAFGAELGGVRADPAQMQQVLVNLVLNARDAMPDGGSMIVETQNVEVDGDLAKDHLGMEPGPHVLLAVSDTGRGMSDATRLRVFEPFFSTKDGGRGSGLSLATTYGIVRQSGGTIWAYSELERGTVFKIYLPRLVTDEQAARKRTTSPRGKETVLIVEDDRAVRSVAVNILRAHGYFVLEAGDGVEGEAVAASFKGTISLLIADIFMPRRNGHELAERLRIARPELRVLFVSGYTERFALMGAMTSPGELLEKPFTPRALAEKVRAVLDQSVEATASKGT